MKKSYVGIDVSKDSFDICSSEGKHQKFTCSNTGFKSFLATLNQDDTCVMESTGSYHLPLANYLYSKGVAVCVLNPVVIKRFSQMRLKQTKTDKSDAKMIYAYALLENPPTWEPQAAYIRQSHQLYSIVRGYFKQLTALKNQLHALVSTREKHTKAAQSLKRSIRHISEEIARLEKQAEELVKENEQDLFSRLKTIPGIGTKTALLLIISTNALKNFENSRQLSSFFGLSPTIMESGKSIRGKGRISKNGMGTMRNFLFMSSFSAIRYNKACAEMYERLVAKGKPKKVALIAVANKLLKQALALAKSGASYEANFQSSLAVKG